MRKYLMACMVSGSLLGIVPGVLAIETGCSGTLANQTIATAIAIEQCVAPIILDVTGAATEDVAQIIAQCQVAAIDIYNYVTALLASAQVVAVTDAGAIGTDGGVSTLSTASKNAHFYTPAQMGKLQRIQKAAAALAGVDAGVGGQ